MSEEKLSSSNKLDIKEAQRVSAGEEKLRESYKPISEDIGLSHVTDESVKNSNMVRGENGNHDTVQDGADEKMLSHDEKETLALKSVEVKFISGDPSVNGDAKIDIGNVEKTFTGMTKEELMKYANDPFWVKLRWLLFILFWAMWIAMLLGAIAIIVYAPKCAAPTPLVWWKKGPLITISGNEDADEITKIKEFNAKGVVYELSGDETYFVDTPLVENKIKKLVEDYKAEDIHVVLDLTANYVTRNDELFKAATSAGAEPEVLSAFVTSDKTNDWKKVGGSESAWKLEGKTYFLSQFGDNIDLQMTSPVAQRKLIDVLTYLVGLGVKGFRLNNAKHLIISSDLSNETPNFGHQYGMEEYGFYTHGKTIYQNGLGNVIYEFHKAVQNATDNTGFLTIRDDSATRVEVFVARNTSSLGFDLPRFVFLNKFLQSSGSGISKKLYAGFNNLNQTINMLTLWMQIAYKPENFKTANLDAAAYNMFMGLLPGVQVVPLDALNYDGNKTDVIKKLEEARESQVFQHGSFDYMLSQNETAFAYTRIKSGMPGYFVAINPSDVDVTANFTSAAFDSELTVWLMSDGVDPPKLKTTASSVALAKHSVGIFTFVPK